MMRDFPEYLKAVTGWHPDIEEQHVRPSGVHQADRRRPVSGFADDRYPFNRRQQILELLSRESLVIRDHRAYPPTHWCLTGSRTNAVNQIGRASCRERVW